MDQRPLASRRALLRAGAAVGTAPISGCAFLWSENSLEELSVSVYNYTEEEHSFDVRLLDEDESTVFEGTFDPPPEEFETRETDVTGGTEYRVLVSVDERHELEGTYRWGGCRADRAQVYVESATEGYVENASSCD